LVKSSSEQKICIVPFLWREGAVRDDCNEYFLDFFLRENFAESSLAVRFFLKMLGHFNKMFITSKCWYCFAEYFGS
jgi:hypothetical protein